MYAIIEAGGRQHKVTTGDRIRINQDLSVEEPAPASTLTFDRVLFIGGEDDPKIGVPTVTGATVTSEVIGAMKGPKIDIVKYKRRKGYHKKLGHRQSLVEVKITAINS